MSEPKVVHEWNNYRIVYEEGRAFPAFQESTSVGWQTCVLSVPPVYELARLAAELEQARERADEFRKSLSKEHESNVALRKRVEEAVRINTHLCADKLDLAAAERKGAGKMRERAVERLERIARWTGDQAADEIGSLPLPGYE